MKVKIDKKEYEELLIRVEALEDKVKSSERYSKMFLERIREQLERFFEDKCRVVMIKRDKEMIVAELRKQVMENLFKGSQDE